MLTFYHYWDSFCSIKTRLVLEEKALDYRAVFVDLLAFEQLKPDYTALNPNGVVPTIEHDGHIVVESTVINEYLDEVFPDPPLMPAEPVDRARARVLVKLEDDKAHEAMRAPTFNLMIKPMIANLSDDEIDEIAANHPQKWVGDYWKKTVRTPIDQKAIDESLALVRDICATLEASLDGAQSWLVGEAFSLADCAFAPMVDRLEHLGASDVFDGFPALLEWIEKLKARPAYGRSVPPDDKRLYSPVGGAEEKRSW